MKTKQFTAQLRREIKTHPKRACLLAGVCGIGIYLWAPLISGWISPDVPKPTAKKKGPVVAAGGTVPAATAPANGTQPSGEKTPEAAQRATMSWRDISRAIRQDWRMKPASDLALSRNPFEPKIEEQVNDTTEPDKAAIAKTPAEHSITADNPATKAADPTPQSLGMKLTGTMIGSRVRSAVINGRVIAEGTDYSFAMSRSVPTTATPATNTNTTPPKKPAVRPATTTTAGSSVKPAQPSRISPIKFKVVRVNPQSVVLARNNKQYELKIDLPQIPDTDVIEFTSAANGEAARRGS